MSDPNDLSELPDDELEELLQKEADEARANAPIVEESEVLVDDSTEATANVYDGTEVEEPEEVVEEVVEETVEEVETTDEPETTEVNDNEAEEKIEQLLLDSEQLKGKKVKLKYMKEDVEVNAEDLIRLSQIGIDADMKGYKDAVKFKKSVDEAGVSEQDIAILQRLKGGDTEALKDMLAATDIKVEDIRDKVYGFEQDDVDATREVYNQPVDSFDKYVSSIPSEIHESYNKLAPTLPGLAEYQQRIAGTKDAKAMSSLVKVLDEGTFEEVAPEAVSKYLSLSELEKQSLSTNDDYFTEFYNGIIEDKYSSNVTQQEQVVEAQPTLEEPTTTPTRRASVDELSTKASVGKPSGQKVQMNSTKPKAKSVQQILDDMDNLDEDEYQAKYLTPQAYK